MEENQISRRLAKLTAIVILISFILLTGGSLILGYLYNSLEKSTNEGLKNEVQKDKELINLHVESDIQTLKSMAAFISHDKTLDATYFVDKINGSNVEHPFASIFYYKKDGNGKFTSVHGDSTSEITIEELNEETRNVMRKAINGEAAVSGIFKSDLSGHMVYAYCVPVYYGSSAEGVLTGIVTLEKLEEIIDSTKTLGSGGYVHLLNSKGDYLIRSSKTIIAENMETLFDGPYVTVDNQDAVKASMTKGESVSSSFEYNDRNYRFILEPVGIGDLYLFCINTAKEINGVTYNMATSMAIAFIVFLVIAIGLLAYGYTALRKNSRKIAFLSYHDPLTGADNLVKFTGRLGSCLGESRDYSIVALNIVQFKFINGLFGRNVADELLIQIYEKLKESLAEGEFFCRDTADLFYLCLKDTDKSVVSARMKGIMDDITEDFRDQKNYLMLMYSGVAIANEEMEIESSSDDVMIHVLFALEKAKGSHHNNIWFYDKKLHEQELMENFVESHMHQALADGEFKMYLQPKIDLHSGALVGAEALVRWQTGDGKMIYPDQFIPIFEKNGFCILLDMYMVECACSQIREWMDAGITPISISVNQSKQVFYEDTYLQKLEAAVAQYSVPAELITLELLERVAVEDVAELNRRIKNLQAKGFRISLDDFGSGYSSLNILGMLHLDELKLDRAFLRIMPEDRQRAEMIMAQILQMSKKMGLVTVIEGVETQENEELMRALGCDTAQGYYYSKPIDRVSFNKKYMNK